MTWTETLRTGWSAVTSHAMRSILTVLGILIGIAAVILTVGLGLGTQKDVSAQISQLGSDLLIVRPGSSTSTEGVRGGFGSRTTLTTADADAVVAGAAARPDDEQVAAQLADLRADVLLRAQPEADREDDGGDTDEDAEHGEDRPHRVRRHRRPARAQGLGPGHRAPSETIRPS